MQKNQTIGTFLKSWMERNNVSQAEITYRAHIDHNSVCKYVSGKSLPHRTTAMRIGKALNLDKKEFDEFMNIVDKQRSELRIDRTKSITSRQSLLSAIRELEKRIIALENK